MTPVAASDLQIREREPSSESADSERERERQMAAVAEREEERRELSSKEVWIQLVPNGVLPVCEVRRDGKHCLLP